MKNHPSTLYQNDLARGILQTAQVVIIIFVADERVGNLTLVLSDASCAAAIKSQLTWIVRGMYSNPPAHGARVVAAVLSNKQLFDQWSLTIYILVFTTRLLVAFYDIHRRKEEVLFFYFVPGTTRDYPFIFLYLPLGDFSYKTKIHTYHSRFYP
jgi:hypothetical protein